MIIARLKGGLGNQMFIYAFARYLSCKHDTDLKLDITYYDNYHRKYELNKFNIIENFASEDEINSLKKFVYKDGFIIRQLKQKLFKKNPKKIPSKTYILDSNIDFKQKYMFLPDNVYLEGLFQSEKFFKEIEEIIRKDFILKNELDTENLKVLEAIKSTNSISLHIRRGDYLTNSWAYEELGICEADYYKKAMDYMKSKVESPIFYVFSDDAEWVKNNFKMDFDFIFIDANNEQSGENDLILMSECNHHICANSSFSWWGAWLGKNQNKIVIAPEKWFKGNFFDYKDLVSESWVKL
ncbi:MAG: hypothetical protein A2X64_07625 [Ignavibacteria bacterium GWF2_33_9]|nr:MAG: hypothetical protein A2X64_07625 [Ignavibacteria bacterium GWF2_33_9]